MISGGKLLSFAALLTAVLLLASCSKEPASNLSTPITAGRTIQASFLQAELIGAYGSNNVGAFPQTPDTSYAAVNSAWLRDFYTRWRADLHRKGVVKWDPKFDCNRFAASFAASAQIEYFTATFHARNAAEALAVGEIWYDREAGGAHAIVIAHTERGPIFIEPQSGLELRLSSAEVASIYFKRF